MTTLKCQRWLIYIAVVMVSFVFGGCKQNEVVDPPWVFIRPPDPPSNPVPADSAMFQSTTVKLRWSCFTPDGYPFTYDVYFGTTEIPPLVVSGIADTMYDPDTLLPNQIYYWGIVAYDEFDRSAYGPQWSFITGL